MQARLFARSVRAVAQVAVAAVAITAFGQLAQAQEEVNVYSYREPGLIDPLLKAFTAKTGIQTNVVFASAGLNERMPLKGR